MAKITPYLRRDNTSTGNTEYLFLPVEIQNWDFESKPVSFTLPGNDDDDLSGRSGTNFVVNLGNQQPKIRVAGVLVDIDSSELPSLGAGEVYIESDGTTGTTPSYTGRDMRDTLADFAAGQSNLSTYNNIVYGWPDWHPDYTSSTTDGDANKVGDTVDGTNYRIWEGNIRNIQTEEKSGEADQFQYSFRFIVGRND